MPSTITHAYFAIDLYDRLDKHKQEFLSPYKDQLKTFAQGPDVFYFYHSLEFKKAKEIRKLGSYMHNHKTQSFFVDLIEYIRTKRLENDPEIMIFLYGMIAHYVLDMTVHPYVLFRTGLYERNKRSTHKYFAGHDIMEKYIDAYMMQVRGNIRPRHFKTHTFCFPKASISSNLSHLIDDVFKKTFNKTSMGNNYAISIKKMKTIFKLLRNDATGIKHKIYRFVNLLPFKTKLNIISYDIILNNNSYYLNLNKDNWHNPLDKDDIYNYSFIELYAIALKKACEIINEVDKVLLRKKNIKYLTEVFPDLSYLTGRDCKLGKGTYFSF